MDELLIGQILAIKIHVCKPKAKIVSAVRLGVGWKAKVGKWEMTKRFKEFHQLS